MTSYIGENLIFAHSITPISLQNISVYHENQSIEENFLKNEQWLMTNADLPWG